MADLFAGCCIGTKGQHAIWEPCPLEATNKPWSYKSSWTDDRLDTLVRMWRENKSGGQIARKLGTTRSAVLGKINRLGLQRRTGVHS